MNDPERVQHCYDPEHTRCVRCGASVQVIEDGFVSILCSGKPIGAVTAANLGLNEARAFFVGVLKSVHFSEPERLKAFENYVRAIVEEGRV